MQGLAIHTCRHLCKVGIPWETSPCRQGGVLHHPISHLPLPFPIFFGGLQPWLGPLPPSLSHFISGSRRSHFGNGFSCSNSSTHQQTRPSIRSSQRHPVKQSPFRSRRIHEHSAISADAHHCVLGCFARQPWVKDTQRSLQAASSHSGSVAMWELASARLCCVPGALRADTATLRWLL